MNKKKKKKIIIIIIFLISIIILLLFSNKKEKEEKYTQISQEEATEIILHEIKEKIEKQGVVLRSEQKTLNSINNGFSYIPYIQGEEKESARIEIYILSIQEKMNMIGKSVQDGEIIIEEGNKKTNVLLYGNILIKNCADENIKNKIIKALQ